MSLPRWLSIEWFIEFDNIAKILLEHSAKSVLDVGCGRNVLCYLLKLLGIQCVGVDIDCKDSVGLCIPYDVRKGIPFTSKSFDAVVMQHFIEHLDLEDQFLVVQEALRVAKKLVIIVTPNKRFPWRKELGDGQYNPSHRYMHDEQSLRSFCRLAARCELKEIQNFAYASENYYPDLNEIIEIGTWNEPKPTLLLLLYTDTTQVSESSRGD